LSKEVAKGMRYFVFSTFMLMMLCAPCIGDDFSEDFEDGDMEGWVVVDDPDRLMSDASPSSWGVRGGPIDGMAVYQGSNRWGDPTDQISLGTYLIYDNTEWVDFIFEFDTVAQDNDGLGFVWRWKDRLNHYRYMMVIDPGSRGPFRRIERRLGDDDGDEFPFYEFLAKSGESYTQGVPIHLSVEVRGSKMTVFMDGKEVLSADDDTYDSGKIGFALYAEQAYFDNVKVTGLGGAVKPYGEAVINWGWIKSGYAQWYF
jgi:hypothetical protein